MRLTLLGKNVVFFEVREVFHGVTALENIQVFLVCKNLKSLGFYITRLGKCQISKEDSAVLSVECHNIIYSSVKWQA